MTDTTTFRLVLAAATIAATETVQSTRSSRHGPGNASSNYLGAGCAIRGLVYPVICCFEQGTINKYRKETLGIMKKRKSFGLSNELRVSGFQMNCLLRYDLRFA